MFDMRKTSDFFKERPGIGKTTTRTSYVIFRFLLLISIGYVVIYPLIYMLSSSVKTPVAFSDPSVIWIPKIFTVDNFVTAYSVMNFGKALMSTLRLEIVSGLIEVMSCAVAAYGLARFNFKGRKILMVMLMLLILLPPQMLIVPLMVNFANLDFLGILGSVGKVIEKDLTPNVLDTSLAFYLPSMFAVGLRSGIMIFIYHQFFKGLPKELEEAAWIDGSNPFRTFVSIAIPSSGVVIMTITVLSIVWHWNDYYLAIMYTSSNYPLAVELAQLPVNLTVIKIVSQTLKTPISMAGALMFVAPVLLLYMILQRQFIKSIDRVGITG